MKKGEIAKSHVKGWQTISEAARERGVTRQRIHQLVDAYKVRTRTIYGIFLVPKPFPK